MNLFNGNRTCAQSKKMNFAVRFYNKTVKNTMFFVSSVLHNMNNTTEL